MGLTYGLGMGLQRLASPGAADTTTVVLRLSSGNVLFPENIRNYPEWLTHSDFTYETAFSETIDFLWSTDRWIAQDEFSSPRGSGVLIQGANSTPARYSNADYVGHPITAGLGVRITASSGLIIGWSGN